jgi:hypothetical protein
MPDRHSGTSARDLIFVPRSFLFLQGPQSSFFERLGRALVARGHRVHRVNLNLGDRLFWRLPAIDFRGRFEAWPGFIAKLLEEQAVTDLIDHRIAISARPRDDPNAGGEILRARSDATLSHTILAAGPARHRV